MTSFHESNTMRELTNEEVGAVAGGLDLSGVTGLLTGVGGGLGFTLSVVGGLLGTAVSNLVSGLTNTIGWTLGSLGGVLGSLLGGL